MSDKVIFPPLDFRRRSGWSGDDLADIRREVQLLAESGLAIDTGWGVSDEGDPWFAVTDARGGDLILHLARLNNSYTAVAPALGGSLHARDPRTLAAETVRRLLRAGSDAAGGLSRLEK